MALRPYISPGSLCVGDSNQEGPSLPGSEHNLSFPSQDMEAVGLAPEGYQFIDLGLSTEVTETDHSEC